MGLSGVQPPAPRPAHSSPLPFLKIPSSSLPLDRPLQAQYAVGGLDCQGAKKEPLREIPAPDEEALLLLSALLSLTKPCLGSGQTLPPPIHTWPPPLSPTRART